MRPIKVCHMSSAHRGLDVRIFHKECCSLANNSYEVTLVISATNTEMAKAASNNIKLIKLNSIEKRWKRILFQNYRCYREALKTKSDIYHFHDPELIPFALLLRLRGKLVIYDVHEDVPKDIMHKDWIPLFARVAISKLTSLIEYITAKYFFEVITSTPFILKRFMKANLKAICVNNFPLDCDIPRVASANRDINQVCYIGGITKQRGLEEIVSSLAYVGDNVQLNLAGDFMEVGFEEKLHRLDSWGKVKAYGYVGREKIREILSKSSAGLVTLHPTSTYIDSLPVKLFEYMAAGLPVIASDFPLWREILDKHQCGILVNPESPFEIASAIKRLVNDEDQAIRMGANGRQAILNEYNWANEEKKLIRLYEELTATRNFLRPL